jgi:galactokinase
VNPAERRATAAFPTGFGRDPVSVAFAPGRVNLIGEHVDYNDGLVLPLALRSGTAVAWAPRTDRIVTVRADDLAADDRFELGAESSVGASDWRNYVRGVAAALADRGLALAGADLAIAGDVPRGGGLSSSASLAVATGRALAAAAGEELDDLGLAHAAQWAEHRFAGVRCGIMDQLAAAAAPPGSALLIDCRTLVSRAIPIPPAWAVLVVLSGETRGLGEGEYNVRRAECEAAARQLGLVSLREAMLEMVETGRLEPPLQSRARHVVGEIARVAAAARALEDADLEGFGALLREGQRSLRDDFAVSTPRIDALVALLDDAIGREGGARMTGGGFGGAVVAVCGRHRADAVTEALDRDYRTPNGDSATLIAAA